VWCHARCNKLEHDERREALSAAAPLVCLKKASAFGTWLQSAKRSPFVLITDWRELKPCLHAVARHWQPGVVASVTVLCSTGKAYFRAMAWAKTMSPELPPVHVLSEAEMAVPSLLAHLLSSGWAAGAGSVRRAPGGQRGPPETCEQAAIAPAATATPVLELIGPLIARKNLMEVEQMLLESMPDHYDD